MCLIPFLIPLHALQRACPLPFYFHQPPLVVAWCLQSLIYESIYCMWVVFICMAKAPTKAAKLKHVGFLPIKTPLFLSSRSGWIRLSYPYVKRQHIRYFLFTHFVGSYWMKTRRWNKECTRNKDLYKEHQSTACSAANRGHGINGIYRTCDISMEIIVFIELRTLYFKFHCSVKYFIHVQFCFILMFFFIVFFYYLRRCCCLCVEHSLLCLLCTKCAFPINSFCIIFSWYPRK